MIGELTEDQGATLAFLEDAASHGLPPGTEITRIDTHASHVFLAGDRVLKMKRAVVYPYLDYGTLARRRWAVEREVALNRRTAPSLYLGTARVRRLRDGRLSLDATGDGRGETVEWLVVMRRFADDALLDRMAGDGRLTPELMRRTSDAVAAFHRAAEPAPDGAGSAAMRAVIAENFEELRAPPGLVDAAGLRTLEIASWRAFDAVAPLLDRRRAEGLVRQCHGDLHLRNICVIDGAPTLFDCIEFNDAFARIDVLYDLAFLLMDLLHRDHADLANAALNAYAGGGDRLDGLAALPLFMAVRATVRAKVALAAAGLKPAGAASASGEIAAYLDLARRTVEPPPPVLVAVGGLPGTGKTTLARLLAPEIGGDAGALHWRSDVIRKQRAGVDELSRLPPAAYTKEASADVYAEMLRRAGASLAARQAVVLDAAFLAEDERTAAEALARAHGVPFAGFWLEAPDPELRERLRNRTGDASDATPAVLDSMRDFATGRIDWQRVDSTRADVATHVLGLIRRAAG